MFLCSPSLLPTTLFVTPIPYPTPRPTGSPTICQGSSQDALGLLGSDLQPLWPLLKRSQLDNLQPSHAPSSLFLPAPVTTSPPRARYPGERAKLARLPGDLCPHHPSSICISPFPFPIPIARVPFREQLVKQPRGLARQFLLHSFAGFSSLKSVSLIMKTR